MRFYIDGDNWEADYFITTANELAWKSNNRYLHNMLLDSAVGAGFCNGSAPAAFRGSVPGCDRTMLFENGIIADPYKGRNLEHSRWSEQYCWGFRTRFRIPAEMNACCNVFYLAFAGVDYAADFYLNGHKLGSHCGAFIPAEWNVSKLLNCHTENILAVVFAPAPQASPNHHSPEPAEFAAFHRSQMSYGWDWMRAMVTTGITDRVWLEGSNTIRIIDGFFRSFGNKVTLELEVSVTQAGTFPLAITLQPLHHIGTSTTIERNEQLKGGRNQLYIKFTAKEPKYWYPNGYGPQPLYRLSVSLADAEWENEVGFRDIVMQNNPDSPADAYKQTFIINGQAIFARGANWVPLELMPGRQDASGYDRLIRLAAEAGFNLIRVWGGGKVECDEFYRCCDRYGMLVWQEFMHSCSSYPDTKEYLVFKRREGKAILKKLRSHVSLALICGGNEVQYYGEQPDSALLHQYSELAAQLTPDLAYHASCPDLAREGERDHGPWSVETHRFYNNHFRLVASEVGCSGMTELESMKKFIPAADIDAFPKAQSWKYHFLHFNDPHLAKQLTHFEASGVAETAQASMFIQADSIQYLMNHYRSNWPRSSGCFIWQFNEPWPTFAYSIVDYYSLPKIAYYRIKHANASAVLAPVDDDIVVASGTDYHGKVLLILDRAMQALRIDIRVLDMVGRVFCEIHRRGDFGVGTLSVAELHAECGDGVAGELLMIELRLTDASGQLIFADETLRGVPNFRKAFRQPPCVPRVTVARQDSTSITFRLDNDSAVTALNVRLQAPELPTTSLYWQDNYCCIAPGTGRSIVLRHAGKPPATILLSGWNVPETMYPLLATQNESQNNISKLKTGY